MTPMKKLLFGVAAMIAFAATTSPGAADPLWSWGDRGWRNDGWGYHDWAYRSWAYHGWRYHGWGHHGRNWWPGAAIAGYAYYPTGYYHYANYGYYPYAYAAYPVYYRLGLGHRRPCGC